MKLSLKIAIIISLGLSLAVVVTGFLFPKYLLIVLLVVSVSYLIWFLIYRLILKPIIYLNFVAKTIASGNLSQRVSVKALDEVGELGENFNKIINNLTSGMQDLAFSLRDEKKNKQKIEENYLKIEREKAKNETLLASIGDAVIAVDESRNIMLINNAAIEMTGINPSAALSQPYSSVLKLLNETDKTPADDFIGKTLAGRKITNYTRIILERANGETVPILQTASPIFDKQNRVTGAVVVLKDITRERELEKLKDEFVSLASHELRTPMTAIKGLISMIFEGDYGVINESLKDPLSDVAASTDRLIVLVNDILDVSRIESGRTKFKITEFFVADLASEVANSLTPLATQKNIQLEVVNTPLDKVSADSDKVKQILINLMNNALKFTDRGAVTVSFKGMDNFAYISITDTGIGISSENAQKLFGKFIQVSNSQLGRPPGSGLGLYLSREYSRKMGGELWVERSEAGKGTTFTFTLPFAGTDTAKQIAEKLNAQV